MLLKIPRPCLNTSQVIQFGNNNTLVKCIGFY